jgi:thioester reductase-like protein
MGLDETVFLTGFPGFIASRLVRQLAREGARLLLLVQPAFVEQATKELDQIAASEGRTRESFRIVPGDISENELGLTSGDLEILRAESTIVFHLAAL